MAAAANVDQPQFTIVKKRKDYEEICFFGHQKLTDLKTKAEGLDNRYLFRDDIPRYPQPEFSVSRLKHDTGSVGLKGIWKDKGFKNPFNGPLVWWSSDIGHEDMMTNPPDEMVEMKPDDLEKFATSPAFLKSSRLGLYRFTFPLKKVLQEYKEQFCDGEQPIMKAFRTYLYKQEVMYVVLVHRPCDKELFLDYPLLTDTPDPVCAYRDGCIIWKAQAMCNTHEWKLVKKSPGKLMKAVKVNPPQFYVWDNVSVALHVGDQVLKFDDNDLGNNLTFCEKGKPFIGKSYDGPEERETLVKELWPDCPALQKPDKVVEMTESLKKFNIY